MSICKNINNIQLLINFQSVEKKKNNYFIKKYKENQTFQDYI